MTSLADLSDRMAEAVAAASGRVVRIAGGGRNQSGILWGNGWIVTAEECLAADDSAAVLLPDGSEVQSEVAGRDPSTDVALLRADNTAAEWVPAPMPALGSIVLAIGRGAEGPLAAFGIVAETGGAWTSATGGRIDARLVLSFGLGHRIEGGAAIDPQGRLIGMAVADPQRRGLVIPADTVARAVATLAEKGYVARGWLGLGLQALRGATGGLIVVDVAENGPGAAASLIVGDVLTSWDGAPLRSMRSLAQRLGPDSVGRAVRLGLLRGEDATEATVTVGERPVRAA